MASLLISSTILIISNSSLNNGTYAELNKNLEIKRYIIFTFQSDPLTYKDLICHIIFINTLAVLTECSVSAFPNKTPITCNRGEWDKKRRHDGVTDCNKAQVTRLTFHLKHYSSGISYSICIENKPVLTCLFVIF